MFYDCCCCWNNTISVVESVNAVNLRYITVSKKYDYFLHVPEAVAL